MLENQNGRSFCRFLSPIDFYSSTFLLSSLHYPNRLGGVKVAVLGSSAVNREFLSRVKLRTNELVFPISPLRTQSDNVFEMRDL